jgi:hypothetical protein
MKSIIAIPIGLLILLALFIPRYLSDTKMNEKLQAVEITKFTTDKEKYGSYEEMKIYVTIKSSKNFGNVKVNVFGIKPHNYAYINDSKIVNLTTGENEIIFSEKTPYCTSGCGGVYPGPYNLHAEVFLDEKLISTSFTTIELVSG